MFRIFIPLRILCVLCGETANRKGRDAAAKIREGKLPELLCAYLDNP
jgi:hypothetical protein